MKYLSIDSTILNNKYCKEHNKHLPLNKNRKGIKVNIICDDIGSPLYSSINESITHDSKVGLKDIHKLVNKKLFKESLKDTKGYPYLLADSGYDSNKIKDKLNRSNIRYIIKPNNINNRYKRKKRISKRFRLVCKVAGLN